MIQLATDPNASRAGWRPAQPGAKESEFGARRARGSHPWPFPSRAVERPAAQQAPRPAGREFGS